MRMTPSPKLIKLLKVWEGYCEMAQPDSGGVPTIGYGHALTLSERRSGKIRIDGVMFDYRRGLTPAQAHVLLFYEVSRFAEVVSGLVNVPLTQDQFDALTSFCYNVGAHAFAESTLLKRLNQSRYVAVPVQLRRWKYDNGEVVQGLINRRELEIALWQGKVSDE